MKLWTPKTHRWAPAIMGPLGGAVLSPLGSTTHRASTASSLLTGLVSYWKLDEASGQRNDSHGTNHLTDNNTVGQAAGKLTNAASFVSANSETLSVVSNADLQSGNRSFSFAGWVYLVNWGIAWVYLITKYANADTGEFILYYDATAPGQGQLSWAVYDHVGGANTGTYALTTLTTGAWYFIYAYQDIATGKVGLSVNDGATQEVNYTISTYANNAALCLGGSPDDSAFYHWGYMDGWGRWNRVLTAAEVTQLYNSGNGLDYPFT